MKYQKRIIPGRNMIFAPNVRTRLVHIHAGARYIMRRSLSTQPIYTPPDLSNLTVQRWNILHRDIKDEVIEYLEWKMKEDWSKLTADEVKASYLVSFGEWGPRSFTHSQSQTDSSTLIIKSIFSVVLFAAVGVSIINYTNDRDVNKKLELLVEQNRQ